MSGSISLLEIVQGLLERTYCIRSELPRIERFVIGDRGYRLLYRGCDEDCVSAGAQANEARTLVRETDEGLRACIYYPDSLIRCLEDRPPQEGLCQSNVDAFATLVEELDHLLVIAERSCEGRPVSMFELELHANVSKHLVLSRFLAGAGRRVGERARHWLRYHLFDKASFCDSDHAVRRRYADATRWSVRFLEALPQFDRQTRLGILRRFHGGQASEKLELIREIAN